MLWSVTAGRSNYLLKISQCYKFPVCESPDWQSVASLKQMSISISHWNKCQLNRCKMLKSQIMKNPNLIVIMFCGWFFFPSDALWLCDKGPCCCFEIPLSDLQCRHYSDWLHSALSSSQEKNLISQFHKNACDFVFVLIIFHHVNFCCLKGWSARIRHLLEIRRWVVWRYGTCGRTPQTP